MEDIQDPPSFFHSFFPTHQQGLTKTSRLWRLPTGCSHHQLYLSCPNHHNSALPTSSPTPSGLLSTLLTEFETVPNHVTTLRGTFQGSFLISQDLTEQTQVLTYGGLQEPMWHPVSSLTHWPSLLWTYKWDRPKNIQCLENPLLGVFTAASPLSLSKHRPLSAHTDHGFPVSSPLQPSHLPPYISRRLQAF